MPSRESTRVFVGNLPHDVRERDIEDFFRKYGRISNVYIIDGRFGFCVSDAFLRNSTIIRAGTGQGPSLLGRAHSWGHVTLAKSTMKPGPDLLKWTWASLKAQLGSISKITVNLFSAQGFLPILKAQRAWSQIFESQTLKPKAWWSPKPENSRARCDKSQCDEKWMIVLLSSETKLHQTSNCLVKYCDWGEGFIKFANVFPSASTSASAHFVASLGSLLPLLTFLPVELFLAPWLSLDSVALLSLFFQNGSFFWRAVRSTSISDFPERLFLETWAPLLNQKSDFCFHGKRPKRPKADAEKKTVLSFELFWSIDVFSEP